MKKIISLLIFLISIFGCKTKPVKTIDNDILGRYQIKDLTINIVENVEIIQKKIGMEFENISIAAFYDPNTKEIWVPKNPIPDENGNLMPNLFLLGHEVWHGVNLNFHSQTNILYSYPTLPQHEIIFIKKNIDKD